MIWVAFTAGDRGRDRLMFSGKERSVAFYVLCEAERFDRRTPPAPAWYQVLINRMILF